MRIAIDISQIAHKGTGVARYTRNLVESVIKFDNTNHWTFFYSSLRQPVPEDIKQMISPPHKLIVAKYPPTMLEFFGNRLHSQFPFLRIVKECDVFISSDWVQPKLPPSVRSITIVHDLVYLRYPETLASSILDVQKRRMKWVKNEVDLIISDSQSTKKDIVANLGISDEKIKVVYPAVDITTPQVDQVNKTLAKYDLVKGKYILSVGKLEPRKNIPMLISAFEKSNQESSKLVIVGPKGWGNVGQQSAPNANVIFLGLVADSDLYALYSAALFFVFPSLYEGFGYPVVEAMVLGCPVATSKTSSLGEIVSSAALTFDPNSEDEIITALETMQSNEKLRADLIKEGKKRATEYTSKKFLVDLLGAITF